MKVILFIFIILTNSYLYASQKIINEKLISVVRMSKVKVRDRKNVEDKYIVKYYNKGDIIDLDYCDKYNWCKIKDEELYISKHTLGVTLVVEKENTINDNLYQDFEFQQIYESSDINVTNEIISPFEPLFITELKCIKLKQIDLNENDILDIELQEVLFKSFYFQCIDSKLLRLILSKISKYYIDNGYITTKPYLIEQDINDGQLDIAVSKGIVEDIIDSNTTQSNSKITTAFISQKGKILNLRDIETSLEVMNRVPSVNAKFKILPGTKQGSSIVKIEEKNSFPLHAQFGASDEGSSKNSEPYLTANISYDNLLNINDILSFRLNGSSVQKSYQGNKVSELNYTFPIGSYFLEAVYFKSSYDRTVKGNNDTYLSSGDTKGTTLKLNKILFRDQKNKLKATMSIQYKDTKNYFSKELIEVSSYKTTLAQIDLLYTSIENWGQLTNKYSLYAGTNWFGARDDNYFNKEVDLDSDAKLQYIKHTLDTNIYMYLKDRTYEIISNLHIQYSNDYLYDNNKLSIGSHYTVRGYLASLYGNNGMYFHNDFIKIFSPNISSILLQTISVFIGLDYGYIDCQKDNVNSCGSIMGSALGFKTDAKHISSDFTVSKYQKKIDGMKDDLIMRYNVLIKF